MENIYAYLNKKSLTVGNHTNLKGGVQMTILLLIKNFFKSNPKQDRQIAQHRNRHIDHLANHTYHI
ncbi:hypothetical protein ABFG93_14340 [Pseudalkalibacillus hwajinpoensis]|uniref:hypothetical protein n=1 Tax=Guptibacillus hwajinpoensis TaxID=208199 RepID=UPI00325BBB43